MRAHELSDEDAQSLLEVSISHVATRLMSAKTAAVMETMAGEEGFEEDAATTPTQELVDMHGMTSRGSDVGGGQDLIHPSAQQVVQTTGSAAFPSVVGAAKIEGSKAGTATGLSAGRQSPQRAYTLQPRPSSKTIERSAETRTALKDGFSDPLPRRRSSGTGEGLKRFLPSLPKPSNFSIPSLPSLPTSFFSSNSNARSADSISLRKRSSSVFSMNNYSGSSGRRDNSPGRANEPVGAVATRRGSAHPDGYSTQVTSSAGLPQSPLSRETTVGSRRFWVEPEGRAPTDNQALPGHSPNQAKSLRRVTSNDSFLLTSTLSRTSSLGDDSRFANHHVQVNSRMKAIRDSLQDRSSFKLPTLPSLPSMPRVPTLGFSLKSPALDFSFSHADSARGIANSAEDVLPGAPKKLQETARSSIDVTPGGDAARLNEPTIEAVPPPGGSSYESYLERAIENLTGDVVIMGGYRGSILRSAKPPHRQLWVPVKVGLNIRKVNLEVGLEHEDEERMHESIYASGMLQHIGPVDISRRLFKRLRNCKNAKNGTLRVLDYGYDWRLSPHLLSRQLITFLESLKSNQPGVPLEERGALVIPHSLGGLITRHAVNDRPELFSGVIYAGVPQACVNILGPLRNGDAVLLSSRVLTAQVNFTLRTSYALLPLDGRCFVDKNTNEEYRVDFFDVNDWVKYRWTPCLDPPLPPRGQQSSGLGGLLNVSGSLVHLPALPTLPIPGKKSVGESSRQMATSASTIPTAPTTPTHGRGPANHSQTSTSKTSQAADFITSIDHGTDRTLAPKMAGQANPVSSGHSTSSSVSTAVTIPRPAALAYLTRTLAEVKLFKQELAFNRLHAESNVYPPLGVIYSKNVPTLAGARVDGREGIACADAYDDFTFGSGDGVCLAREVMLPDGYATVRGGRISSERGHVTLLGDLNAVGRAIEAVVRGRKRGIGLGRGMLNDRQFVE